MARQARKKASSGIYHIILRGINRQTVFEDDEDIEKFKDLLIAYKKRSGYELLGYCFMGNHIHLLIHEAANPSVLRIKGRDVELGPGESLETVFKRIGAAYVYYFNQKYKRTGHLFQDRFRSEAIETDSYLLMALRYIHRNPVKAGICKDPGEYPYSSYPDYLGNALSPAADTDLLFSMISLDELISYTAEENNDSFLEIEETERKTLTDQETKELMKQLSGCDSASAFQKLPKDEKETAFRKLREEGASIAQISRITGHSRPLIYRALEQ